MRQAVWRVDVHQGREVASAPSDAGGEGEGEWEALLLPSRCCKPFSSTTHSLLQAFALQALTAWVRAIRLCLRPYLSIYIYLSIYLYLYILYITYTYVCMYTYADVC